MFNNLSFGPIAGYSDRKDIIIIQESLLKEGFIPLYTLEQGEFFEKTFKRENLIDGKPILGVIITIAYKSINQD